MNERKDLQLVFDHDFVGGVLHILQNIYQLKNESTFLIRVFEQN